METYEYFSVHSKGSEGVLVLVQHYRDIPLMRKESFVLGPGTGKFIIKARRLLQSQAAQSDFFLLSGEGTVVGETL